MFGIDSTELLIILAVAIVVIGPKDLPQALYALGKIVRKFKTIMADVQRSVDSVMQEGELEEIIQEANKPGGENLQAEIERQIQIEDKSNGHD